MTIRYNGPGEKMGTKKWDGSSPQGMSKPRLTDVFTEQSRMTIPGLKTGERIDSRFLVKEAISLESGEGDIYRCLDEVTNDTVAIKFYRVRFKPKEQIVSMFMNLHHPDLVRVVKYGVWNDRFYEAMEYCAGGMLTNYFPLNVEQIRSLLPEIINGLQYLHDQNIIHRDIKPDNFYFRDTGMKDLVIGDFGISSLIASDKHTHKTDIAAWTIDYTAPEVFRDSIYKASDYYSLGITLMHASLGESPLSNIITREAKGFAIALGNIPRIDDLPAELSILVKGLIQINPENRWSFSQINQWLKGERVYNNAGQPWQEDVYAGKETPYPSYTEAKNPRQLARVLDKFDAQTDLFRAYISKWAFNDFKDAELSKRIEEIEENYSDRKPLGVLKLGFVLDPSLPLKILDREISSIQDLTHVLQVEDKNIRLATRKALFDGYIECWIEETQEVGEGKKHELLQHVADIRKKYHQDEDLGLFALHCCLNPTLAFPFGKERLDSPKKLAEKIDANRSGWDTGKDLLSKGWIGSWLIHTGRISGSVIENLTNSSGGWDAKLEAVMHLLDPQLPHPKPTLKPKKLIMGKISNDSEITKTITVKNSGRGYLSGNFTLEGEGSGFAVSPSEIEGGPSEITITVNAIGLPAQSNQRKNLVFNSNVGRIEVPLSYKVSAPLYKMIARSLLVGLLFGFILGFIRWIFNGLMPLYSKATVDWLEWSHVYNFPYKASVVFLTVIMIIIAAFVYKTIRKLSIVNKAEH